MLAVATAATNIEQFLQTYCQMRGFRSIHMLDPRSQALLLARSLSRQGLRIAVGTSPTSEPGPSTLTVLRFEGTGALAALLQVCSLCVNAHFNQD
jgi:hypothetical protein